MGFKIQIKLLQIWISLKVFYSSLLYSIELKTKIDQPLGQSFVG